MHDRPLTKLLCAVASAIGLSACLTASAYAPLIDQGVDVVFQHTDSPAPIHAAERRSVYAVGYASDMAYFGPKALLTSIVNDWKSLDYRDGLSDGAVELPISNLVPTTVKSE